MTDGKIIESSPVKRLEKASNSSEIVEIHYVQNLEVKDASFTALQKKENGTIQSVHLYTIDPSTEKLNQLVRTSSTCSISRSGYNYKKINQIRIMQHPNS